MQVANLYLLDYAFSGENTKQLSSELNGKREKYLCNFVRI
jgi:hypothetical protein